MNNRFKTLSKKLYSCPKVFLLGTLAFVLVLLNSLDLYASGLEGAIDKVDTLFKGKIIKVGVGISAAAGFIRSIISGNIALAFGIIAICIGFFFLMGWLHTETFGV